MYRSRYETYGTSKYAKAMPKILEASATIGSALGSSLVFGAKGIYDIFANYPKNKILDKNIMAYPRRTKRPAFGRRRRSYKKKQYKSTKSKKSRKSFNRSKPKLAKQVRQIQKKLGEDSARHTYKWLRSRDVQCAVNAINYEEITISTATNLEQYIANLRYYDPSVPGTLVTASGATGTYQRTIHFKNISQQLIIRNNYQVPCKVKVYLVKAKGDTNIVPLTYYTNGITDQVISGGNLNTAGIFPTDLNAFMSQWSCKCVKDVILDAGAMVMASHNTGHIKYDPSVYDEHTLDYQRKFKSASFIVRVEGVVAHDTSADQQTTLSGGVDIEANTRAEINYDAGIALDDIYVYVTRSTSFTNGGVLTNKPIADNQPSSVA